jgi:hypothetical protein
MDWDGIVAGVGFGASASATVVSLWAVVQMGRRVWDRTIGRRRVQSRVLNRLACGSHVQFVESFLGVAQFVSFRDGFEQRAYRLSGAWIMLELSGSSVESFSITVTDPTMHFLTRHLTFGQIDVKLGRSDVGVAPAGTGDYCWVGARRYGFLRHYDFGNPGCYQNYWLSYNMAGAGQMQHVRAFTSGDYSIFHPERGDGSDINQSGIPVNTLTVVGPNVAMELFMARTVLGVDHDHIRLAGPSATSTRRAIRSWLGAVRARRSLS